MWVFTETGFVSAVVHRDDSEMLMVRARDKKSLEGLAEMSGVKTSHTPGGDYPHRVVVSKSEFQEWLMDRVVKMDYDNFKSQVAKTRGHKFAAPLHDVWSVMHDVEEDDARGSLRGSLYRDYNHTSRLYDLEDEKLAWGLTD